MEDQELEQLRQKRLAELQGAGGSQQQQQQQQEEMRKQQAEMKNSVLAQVLTQDARTRCKKKILNAF